MTEVQGGSQINMIPIGQTQRIGDQRETGSMYKEGM